MMTALSESKSTRETQTALAGALAAWDEHDVLNHRPPGAEAKEADREFLVAVLRRVNQSGATASSVVAAGKTGSVHALRRRIALADPGEIGATIWFLVSLPVFMTTQHGGWAAVAAGAFCLAAGAALEYIRIAPRWANGE